MRGRQATDALPERFTNGRRLSAQVFGDHGLVYLRRNAWVKADLLWFGSKDQAMLGDAVEQRPLAHRIPHAHQTGSARVPDGEGVVTDQVLPCVQTMSRIRLENSRRVARATRTTETLVNASVYNHGSRKRSVTTGRRDDCWAERQK